MYISLILYLLVVFTDIQYTIHKYTIAYSKIYICLIRTDNYLTYMQVIFQLLKICTDIRYAIHE